MSAAGVPAGSPFVRVAAGPRVLHGGGGLALRAEMLRGRRASARAAWGRGVFNGPGLDASFTAVLRAKAFRGVVGRARPPRARGAPRVRGVVPLSGGSVERWRANYEAGRDAWRARLLRENLGAVVGAANRAILDGGGVASTREVFAAYLAGPKGARGRHLSQRRVLQLLAGVPVQRGWFRAEVVSGGRYGRTTLWRQGSVQKGASA